MNGVHIQEAMGPTVAEGEIEIVERKGRGHPDTLCDAVMERIAQSLSRVYLDRFGALLHFNCDKGLLVAGRVVRRFGGGEVLEPMRLVIGDRATSVWKGETIDVAEIAIASAKAWFRENLPHVDPDRHLHYQVELKKDRSLMLRWNNEGNDSKRGSPSSSRPTRKSPSGESRL